MALEPFRQVASPFARNTEGTGLGLALIKSLIECHDGRLEIESALNRGARQCGWCFRRSRLCEDGVECLGVLQIS